MVLALLNAIQARSPTVSLLAPPRLRRLPYACWFLPAGEGALFEFDAAKQWRERGRGEMRVNVASRCAHVAL